MSCVLMNKNTPVMLIDYSKVDNAITNIIEIYNIEYAPLAIFNAYNDKSQSLVKESNAWFRGRGIPSWRKDLENLLEKLNVSSPEELLNKSFSLSLSDQYWLKDSEISIKWEDINFFTNDFLYEAYLEASLDSSSNEISTDKNVLRSPNNTTDGMLQKGWIIENGKRVLVKGTYTFNREEPFNEWLASQVCKRLGFSYCNYTIDFINNEKLVSKCENFVSSDEEIISAYDIYKSVKKPNNINDYEHYINILEQHNVPDARKNVASMFLVDYILMNTNRHMKNFGVIRNVNTLKWERTAPIFDTGQSMQCDRIVANMNFVTGTGKFFSNTNKKYDDILKTVLPDVGKIDVSLLDGLADVYEKLLKDYGICDFLCFFFAIQNLDQFQSKINCSANALAGDNILVYYNRCLCQHDIFHLIFHTRITGCPPAFQYPQAL